GVGGAVVVQVQAGDQARRTHAHRLFDGRRGPGRDAEVRVPVVTQHVLGRGQAHAVQLLGHLLELEHLGQVQGVTRGLVPTTVGHTLSTYRLLPPRSGRTADPAHASSTRQKEVIGSSPALGDTVAPCSVPPCWPPPDRPGWSGWLPRSR